MVSATDPVTLVGRVTFDLCGGHPVLDFVNSLDNRFNSRGCIEGLQSYDDLLRFTRQTQLLDSARLAQLERTVTAAAGLRALRAARALREAVAATLYALVSGRPPAPNDLQTLERHFHTADRQLKLRWQQRASQRHALAWSWQPDADDAELPVWALAHAARDLLTSPEMERVRTCEADTCRWLFLDTSKSHTRRWCKMKVCGNRMKARRYQSRHSG